MFFQPRKMLFLVLSLTCWSQSFTQEKLLDFEVQLQVKKGKEYQTKFEKRQWKPSETAIIICDMWDQHWCATATQRVMEMAPAMNEVVQNARAKGVTIVHAPSSTMDYYIDYPQRKKMIASKPVPESEEIQDWYKLDLDREATLPIDDTDGGCDDPNSTCVNCEVWKKQIDAIEISDEDCISDSGKEINNYFVSRGIKNVLIMGVHTNMCVLGRSFGIRSHVTQGRNVLLVRDLTDAMYNPTMDPKVSHFEGTSRVIDHIEKFWCPTITSNQLK